MASACRFDGQEIAVNVDDIDLYGRSEPTLVRLRIELVRRHLVLARHNAILDFLQASFPLSPWVSGSSR